MKGKGYIAGSQTVEWYTPMAIIEAAREVLGGIDLDPASCAEANAIVSAARYYSREDDGLKKPWAGRVWLNPPYGAGIGTWVGRLLHEFKAGHVSAGILLVNANTDAKWFGGLWSHPICFTRGRVRFRRGDGTPASQPAHGSAIVYLGPDHEKFARLFEGFGHVARPHKSKILSFEQPSLFPL